MASNPTANGNPTASNPTAVQAVAATVTAVVATLLNTVATFARYHTRGAVAMCSYHIAGTPGIVFCHTAQFANGIPPQTLAFTVPPIGAVVPAGSTLLTYRGAVAGGKVGRSSYSALGVRGTFTVCNTLFGGNPAPTSMVVNAALVAGVANTGAHTSAKVAAGNVAQAGKAGTPVATPATVATVAGKVAAAIVAATPAAQPTAKLVGKTAAQRQAHGKQVS